MTTMDIINAIRNDIEEIRDSVPRLDTGETIQVVEQIRRLESLVADVIAERQRSAILAGRSTAAVAVVVSGPVVRPSWQAPARVATPAMPAMPRLSRGLSVGATTDEAAETAGNGALVSRWADQRGRCFAALVALYSTLVSSREAGLDY